MYRIKSIPSEIQVILIKALMKGSLISASAYSFVWFIYSFWAGLNVSHTLLYQIILAILLVNLFSIVLISNLYAKSLMTAKVNKIKLLTGYELYLSLFWGVLTAYLVYFSGLTDEQAFMLRMILVGIAAIGGALWSLVNPVGVVYSVLAILPHNVCSYWLGDPNAWMYNVLAAMLLIFLQLSIRNVQSSAYLQFLSEYTLMKAHADSMEAICKLDFVTKLTNRFHFLVGHQRLWQKASKSNRPVSLIGIRIDLLEEVNKKHGHAVGNGILASAAKLLKDALDQQLVGTSPMLGRYDAKHLMISIPNITKADAQRFIDTVCYTIQEQVLFAHTVSLEVAINCSTCVVSNIEQVFDSSDAMVNELIKQLECKSEYTSDNSAASSY